jgi:hypothetical protein
MAYTVYSCWNYGDECPIQYGLWQNSLKGYTMDKCNERVFSGIYDL